MTQPISLREDLEDSIAVNNLARTLRRMVEARHPDVVIDIDDCRDWIRWGLTFAVPHLDRKAMAAADGHDGADAVGHYFTALSALERER